MDDNYKLIGNDTGCYDDIHEAFITTKELEISIFYEDEQGQSFKDIKW
jgi:hypothetical protein